MENYFQELEGDVFMRDNSHQRDVFDGSYELVKLWENKISWEMAWGFLGRCHLDAIPIVGYKTYYEGNSATLRSLGCCEAYESGESMWMCIVRLV